MQGPVLACTKFRAALIPKLPSVACLDGASSHEAKEMNVHKPEDVGQQNCPGTAQTWVNECFKAHTDSYLLAQRVRTWDTWSTTQHV